MTTPPFRFSETDEERRAREIAQRRFSTPLPQPTPRFRLPQITNPQTGEPFEPSFPERVTSSLVNRFRTAAEATGQQTFGFLRPTVGEMTQERLERLAAEGDQEAVRALIEGSPELFQSTERVSAQVARRRVFQQAEEREPEFRNKLQGLAAGLAGGVATAGLGFPSTLDEPASTQGAQTLEALGMFPPAGAASGISRSVLNQTLRNSIQRIKDVDGNVVTAVGPSVTGRNVWDIRPIQVTESKARELQTIVGELFSAIPKVGRRVTPPSSTVAAVFREQQRVLPAIDSRGNALRELVRAEVLPFFERDSLGRVSNLPNVVTPDGVARGAPTIQDVAARLDTYGPHLTENQRLALERLRDETEQYGASLREMDIDVHTRADIEPGGFYLPRGSTIEEGMEETLKGSGSSYGRGVGRQDIERSATEPSMAQFLTEHSDFRYLPFEDAMAGLVKQSGKRALTRHIDNTMTMLLDPISGLPYAHTSAERVSPALRAQWTRLGNRIRNARTGMARGESLVSERTRALTRAEKQAELRGAAAETGQARAAEAHDVVFDIDIQDARKELDEAIIAGRSLSATFAENRIHMRAAQKLSAAEEAGLERLTQDMDTALAEASNLTLMRMAVGATTLPRRMVNQIVPRAAMQEAERAINRIEKSMERLLVRSEETNVKLEQAILQGDVLKELKTENRLATTQAKRNYRISIEQDMHIRSVNREMRMLEREFERMANQAGRAGVRREAAQARLAGVQQRLTDLRNEQDALKGAWQRELRLSRETPRGQARILGRPSLMAYTFPDAMAEIFDREIKKGDKKLSLTVPLPGGFQPDLAEIFMMFNQFYRATRATMDLSAVGIQGALFIGSNLVDAGTQFTKLRPLAREGNFLVKQNINRNIGNVSVAMDVMLRSLTDKKVLGQALHDMSRISVTEGRLGVLDAANVGLRIGGEATEFLVPGKGIKIVRAANRAFGSFGDMARFSWFDTLLELEMQGGRSLDEIMQSGDIEHITRSANRMTGHANNLKPGNLGDMIAFAPRFLESRFTTMTNAASGVLPGAPLEQRLAAKAMTRFVGLTALTTFMVNNMLGEETDWRPIVDGHKNPNFMAIRFQGRDWKLLGTWDGLLGLMVGAGTLDLQPFLGLSSGIVQNAWDIMQIGRGVATPFERSEVVENVMENIGEGVDTEDRSVQVAARLLENVIPFSMNEYGDPMFDEQPFEGDALGALAIGTTFGAKSSPLSASENLKALRDEAAQRLRGKPYDEVSQLIKAQINADPEIQQAVEARDKRALDFNSEWAAFDVEVKKKREEAFSTIKEATVQLGPGKGFRDLYADKMDELTTQLTTLRQTEQGQKATAFIDKLEPSQQEFDIALDDYYSEMANAFRYDPLTDDVIGDDLPDVRRKLRLKYGDARFEQIEKFTAQRDETFETNGVNLVKELKADRDLMRPYFHIAREVAQERDELALYERWRRANAEDRKRIEITNPNVLVVLKFINLYKTIYRMNNTDVARALKKWEYLPLRTGNPTVDIETIQRVYGR